MTWMALFSDGPLQGKAHDRMFMGAHQRELYFIPHPTSTDNWILVGTDAIPPDTPWPGQVRYVRDDARSQLLDDIPPGENEGWAMYRVVTP